MESEGPALLSALSPARVMLVEDDEMVGDALRRAVERAGMQVCWATTGKAAVEMKRSFKPDVVLVDLELPDVHGVALIKWLVEQHDCGVIVVSGVGEDTDRIVGLELGADDYITKPPNIRELVARIRAVHRRLPPRIAAHAATQPPAPATLRIDFERRTVHNATGDRIMLTAAEFAALALLSKASGSVVTRDDLSLAALSRPWRPDDRSVDQLVLNLRQKLPTDGDGHSMIESVRGSGYLLRKDR